MSIAPDRPDWRWHTVTTLLNYTHSKAIVLAQQLDPLTQKVYKFRRQFKDRLITTLPSYVAAHEIWMQRPYQRSVLEGLLLGEATDELIQSEMEIGVDDIAAYVSMFFDIRGRKRMDIANMVFQGMPHKGYHPHDSLGVQQRLGWFGGARLIQAILAKGLNEDAAQSYCAEVCRDIIRRQLPEIGLSASYDSENAPEYVRLATEWDAAKGASGSTDLVAHLKENLLRHCTVSVADSTDATNMSLPAKEPRFIAATEVPDAAHV